VLFDTIYINCFGFHFRRILVFPYGNDTDCVSIYLDYIQSHNSHQSEIRDVTFKLFVFNQFDSCMSITKSMISLFSFLFHFILVLSK
jgi:hypothetical protein